MENKIGKKNIGLLPMYFKKIGLAVIIISLITAIVVHSTYFKMGPEQKEWFKLFTLNAFILGLSFISLSRDKAEDEMTVLIRLKAIAFAFSFAVITVIISPFVDLLLNNPVENESGRQVIITMLFFYLVIYYFRKLGS